MLDLKNKTIRELERLAYITNAPEYPLILVLAKTEERVVEQTQRADRVEQKEQQRKK